jgi:hypothetical protein
MVTEEEHYTYTRISINHAYLLWAGLSSVHEKPEQDDLVASQAHVFELRPITSKHIGRVIISIVLRATTESAPHQMKSWCCNLLLTLFLSAVHWTSTDFERS